MSEPEISSFQETLRKNLKGLEADRLFLEVEDVCGNRLPFVRAFVQALAFWSKELPYSVLSDGLKSLTTGLPL